MADQWELDTLAAMPSLKWCSHCERIAAQTSVWTGPDEVRHNLDGMAKEHPGINFRYVRCRHWTSPQTIARMLIGTTKTRFHWGAVSLKNDEFWTYAVLVCHM